MYYTQYDLSSFAPSELPDEQCVGGLECDWDVWEELLGTALKLVFPLGLAETLGRSEAELLLPLLRRDSLDAVTQRHGGTKDDSEVLKHHRSHGTRDALAPAHWDEARQLLDDEHRVTTEHQTTQELDRVRRLLRHWRGLHHSIRWTPGNAS